jgi:hypothetical protein
MLAMLLKATRLPDLINKPVSSYAFLSILSVFVLTVSVLVNWDLPVHAQTPISVNFLTYQNPTEGYSIQYPSDWEVTGNGISDAVIRFSPSDVSELSLIVTTTKPAPYLDIVTMTVKNTTSQQLLQEKLLFDSVHKIPFRKTNVTVGENSGIKNEYLVGNTYSFEVLIIGNGKLYTLAYNDDSLNVPKTLPVINKMVESFQFIP